MNKSININGIHDYNQVLGICSNSGELNSSSIQIVVAYGTNNAMGRCMSFSSTRKLNLVSCLSKGNLYSLCFAQLPDITSLVSFNHQYEF